MAAAAHGLAGRPAEVFCQARDTLSHDVRECRRGLTLTVCRALSRRCIYVMELFDHAQCVFLSNPARLAPANATVMYLMTDSDAFRTARRAQVGC